MERVPPAYMGRPRRKLPSPGPQWFVARRFPTLAARSFQPPLHGFPPRHPGADTLAMSSQRRKPRTIKARMPRQRGSAALDRLLLFAKTGPDRVHEQFRRTAITGPHRSLVRALTAGRRMRGIQGFKLLRGERQRQRDGVFAYMRRRAGFRNCYDVAAADG